VAGPSVDAGPKHDLGEGDLLLADPVRDKDALQRELDELGDLFGTRRKGRGRVRDSHDRDELEVRHRDPDRVEPADNPHDLAGQPDLLVRLAERGVLRAGIGRVDRATGEAHLAGMGGELRVTDGQRDDQLPVGWVDEQEGGRCPSGREAGPVEAPLVIGVEGRVRDGPPDHDPRVDWDGSLNGGQGMGDDGLPVPLSP
jgi:hypothetical protein